MWNTLAEISDSEFVLEGPDDILRKNNNIIKNEIWRKEVNFTANLPDAILFDILAKVAAKDHHENVRLVCKAWKEMISASHFIS